MPVPEQREGPISRDTNELRLSKHSGACCRGSMRCQCPKRPKGRTAEAQTPQGLLSGKHAMPVPEKNEGPVCRDAIDFRPCKHRRACCRGSMRCPCPKRPKGQLAEMQTNCGPANTAGPAVGEGCDARTRKDRRAS